MCFLLPPSSNLSLKRDPVTKEETADFRVQSQLAHALTLLLDAFANLFKNQFP